MIDSCCPSIRVDPDGIAEQKGLKVGDQIIAVNGHSFEEATHMEAVEIMKSDKQLVMTVRVCLLS